MRVTPLSILVGLALSACGTDTVLPTPDGPSASIIVHQTSGAVDTMGIVNSSLRLEETVPSPGDTVRCLTGTVEGPLLAPPGEGEDLKVDWVQVQACGDRFTVVPGSWHASVGDAGEPIATVVRASTIGHAADSGSVSVKRLGGGYAEMTFSLRYYPIGSDLPPDFRVEGLIIAQDSTALAE